MPIVTRHTIAEQKRQKVRILVAEDNPMNQKLAVTILKKAGFWVDAVDDGLTAIEALKQKAYDLVFMDVQMPEMDGFEATKAIREMEGGKKHTPIVAMTAHAMKGDRERCLKAGMDDYISKPVETKEMIETVENWVKPSNRKFPATSVASPETRLKSVRTEDELKGVPLDIETALLRFDGDKEFLNQMLQEFINHLPQQLQTLEGAVKKDDAKVVEKEAHTLKGAAGNLGARRIAELSLKLELLGRSGDLVGAQEMIENLKAECKHLEEYIPHLLKMEDVVKSNSL